MQVEKTLENTTEKSGTNWIDHILPTKSMLEGKKVTETLLLILIMDIESR